MNLAPICSSRRRFCAASVASPLLTLALPGCGGGSRLETDAPARWADIAIRAAALAPPPGLPPFISARAYAMAFLAAHDALQAIVPVFDSYLVTRPSRGANADAAVATAVHDVLVHELPFAQGLLDEEYTLALDAVKGAGSRPKGVELGRTTAAAMLAHRADDGLASIDGPFVEGTLPGEYRFTPPFDFAAGVHLGDRLRPFAISHGAAYRVAPPYSVAEPAYAVDYDEVKSMGAAVGSTRTPEQSEIAAFWLENTNDSWMRVAMQIAQARETLGWDLMRTLALLQMAQVDTYIACFDSKYHYHFWRPITAIALGDSDGNDATVGDATWSSYIVPCPPIPDYPSGHAASGGSGAAVLQKVFGGDAASFTHQSTTLPGPTRSYTSFSQMADEIGVSRIYNGFHFRLAVDSGLAQGRAVTLDLLASQLKPRY